MKSLIISMLLSFSLLAQIPPGARQTALANADAALEGDPFCIFNNPAGISAIIRPTLALCYSPSLFGMTELASYDAVLSYPFAQFNVSAALEYFGFELYSERILKTAIAAKIFEKLAAGLTINYKFLTISNYGSTSSYTFDAGLITYLTNAVSLAFSIQNLTRSSYPGTKDQLPVTMNMGFSFAPANHIKLLLAAEKELNMNTSFRSGIEYLLENILYLRAGISNYPDKYSAGLGIKLDRFHLDYSLIYHNELKDSQRISIIFEI